MKVRKWLLCLLAVVLLFSMTACGATSESADNMFYRADVPAEEMGSELVMESPAGGAEALPENRKLIKTVRMQAETETLDEMLAALDSKIGELGGYVESREVYNGSTYAQRRYRHANLTIRIPAENVAGFVEHVSGISNVVSSDESVEDITLQYVDTESRVAALEVEQERLMAMLEQAENLQDLLEIESRLTDVRYELENYASRLRAYDNKVDYATIHLNIEEVQEYTPVAEETVWQRISGGFVDSLRNIGDGIVEFGIWMLVNSPYLVLYGVIGTGIVVLIRKRRAKNPRKSGKTKNPPPPENAE